MKILLCGFHEACGIELVENILKKERSNTTYTISYNFFNIYCSLKTFDYIILCICDVIDITNDKNEMLQLVQKYNCWIQYANLKILKNESNKIKHKKIKKLIKSKSIEINKCNEINTNTRNVIQHFQYVNGFI
jgi:hypothetical protein